jgi:hypothetical protein
MDLSVFQEDSLTAMRAAVQPAFRGFLARASWIEQPGFCFEPGLEGFRDFKFGGRAGPFDVDSISVDNLAHELAHAVELPSTLYRRISEAGWGFRIKSGLTIGGVYYEEARTLQATEREARVFGIQWHILESAGHTIGPDWAQAKAKLLADFMPDWVFGGDSAEARIACRAKLIQDAYRDTNLEEIQHRFAKFCAYLQKRAHRNRFSPEGGQ